MRIGIIGAGHIGGTLAELLARAGHQVTVSNSRGPETLAGLVERLGERGRAGTPSEAAGFGEVVVVSVPLGRYRDVPAGPLAGKIVVDTNNYYPQRDGAIAELDGGGTTSSELLAARWPGARVVKAFNTIYWERLRDQGRPGAGADRLGIPLAGDDAEAKRVVAGLIDELGFDPVDNGGLAEGGRRQQPGSPVYNVPLTGDELRRRLSA
jgi:8-hydroxy-5-deazaflavin:NADPH oxidoreductase